MRTSSFRFIKLIITVLAVSVIAGCLGMPEKVKPINQFELPKYLGKWYEVARLDHSFERGLSQVTAEYQLKEGGGVKVINRGFSDEENEWSEALGKAYFVEDESTGYLKVSFFGPFYGSYVIFEMDQENYQYAFVSGPDTDFLWLLSRTPDISDELRNQFITSAQDKGFDTSKLIFVKH
ncbi:lipocalin family protein [Psychrosphaera haliotis]|uniref:lipocalin family protein n=1 Tax=Psychrosphaera haliotis TaxID=555083 RepID=UPI0033754087